MFSKRIFFIKFFRTEATNKRLFARLPLKLSTKVGRFARRTAVLYFDVPITKIHGDKALVAN